MDVALLGVVVAGIENHSLGVLRAALDDAELEHCTIPFEGFAGMEHMLREIERIDPRVCGISLQTTESMLAVLAFTAMQRKRGFRGLIVIGGHVASLAADEILASPAGVDVVVELAGEAALVGLARGEDPRSLPGTRTRDGRGLAPTPVQPRAHKRERLSEHLGFAAADLVLSRGCGASCGYCCVAAVSDAAERTGGERQVARDVALIADEIAESGARAFHIMDDNVLPLDPTAAIAWARSLQAALAARKVPPIAFSLQLRADVVTAELADLLVGLGLVRAYIGIDGYSPAQLRAIGRHAPAEAGNRAIELLNARGVLCVVNALVVGPTIRLETLVDEVAALAKVRGAPVHLLPIEARPGTVYHKRAAARGLIEGGALWPSYRFEDERTFLVSEILTGLPSRLLERSVPIALYDLAWGIGVARRLAPLANVDDAIATYQRVTAAWNADQVRVLQASIEAALLGRAAIDELRARELAFVRAHDDALLRACDDALLDVERRVSAVHRTPVRAHARGRILGGLAVAMGLAAACSPSERTTPNPGIHDAYVQPDAPPCADPSRSFSLYPESDETCACADTSVQMTYDANGVVTGIAGQDGSPLPSDLESCLLPLFAMHCYPNRAGMTLVEATCHRWIA